MLLGCAGTEHAPGVPLIRRLFFGVLAREGLRREELASLRWRDLDLNKGHIALDRNKTDDPRSWALDRA
jgi:integrase